jgi:alpha-mannosidase
MGAFAPATSLPAHASVVPVPEALQRVSAVGHCHIDTAWLWPYAETRRKVARSWATQLELLRRYPHHKFAFSQAQQVHWLREDYPDLYSRVRKAVAAGSFLPVGGTWVEQDANIPGSEAMVRQFLYGQRLFAESFGVRSQVFWLPDTFGYCAQLPQILRGVGQRYFLTQKLSWNLINPFPYHSFLWRGIDGSQVLAHFPPTDTYTANVGVGETAGHQRNYREQAVSRDSALLFGNGDGGGGPQGEMIERLDRLDCAPGMPQLTYDAPEALYARLEQRADELPRYDGELYLELHRGTYTTQAVIKQGNGTLQQLLHDAEALGVFADALGAENACGTRAVALWRADGASFYPRGALDRAWHSCLLNHFHDVLPGSCIHLIVEDAVELYRAAVAETAAAAARAAVALCVALGHTPDAAATAGAAEPAIAVVNTLAFARTEVIEVPDELLAPGVSAGVSFEDDPSGDAIFGIPYPDLVQVPASTGSIGDAAGAGDSVPVAFTNSGSLGGRFTSGAGVRAPRLVSVTVPAAGVATVAVPKAAAAVTPAVVAYRDRVTYLVPATGAHAVANSAAIDACAADGSSKAGLATALVRAQAAAARARTGCGVGPARADLAESPASLLPLHVSAALVRGASLRYRRATASTPAASAAAAALAAAAAGNGAGAGALRLRAVTEDVFVLENELVRYEVSVVSGRVVRAFDKRPAASPGGAGTEPVYRAILLPASDEAIGVAYRRRHERDLFATFATGAAAIASGRCGSAGAGADAETAAEAAEACAWERDGTPLSAVLTGVAAAADCGVDGEDSARPCDSPTGSFSSWTVTGSHTTTPQLQLPAAANADAEETEVEAPPPAGPVSAGAAAAADSDAAARAVLAAALSCYPGLTSEQAARRLAGESVAGGGALWVYRDVPLYWDAWDAELYHLQTRRLLAPAPGGVQLVESRGLRAVVEAAYPLRVSAAASAAAGGAGAVVPGTVVPKDTLVQRLSLVAGSAQLTADVAVDWRRAAHDMLKSEWPMAVRAPTATYEIQFGSASRAAHTNTSWDLAKFEVCAQRWGAAAEGTYTVGLLSKAKHGFACRQGVMTLSLLRSPTRPDDRCDLHVHRMQFALAPYASNVSTCGITRDAAAFGAPLALVPVRAADEAAAAACAAAAVSLLRSSHPDVIVEAVKKAEPAVPGFEPGQAAAGPEDTVLRIYESAGSAAVATITVDAALVAGKGDARAALCNMLEDVQETLLVRQGTSASGRAEFSVGLALRPFEIKTLRFIRGV